MKRYKGIRTSDQTEKTKETETNPGLHMVLRDRILVLNTCNTTLNTSYRDYVVVVRK